MKCRASSQATTGTVVRQAVRRPLSSYPGTNYESLGRGSVAVLKDRAEVSHLQISTISLLLVI